MPSADMRFAIYDARVYPLNRLRPHRLIYHRDPDCPSLYSTSKGMYLWFDKAFIEVLGVRPCWRCCWQEARTRELALRRRAA